MRLIIPQNPVPTNLPNQLPEKPQVADPCRCDDDKVDWRQILKGM